MFHRIFLLIVFFISLGCSESKKSNDEVDLSENNIYEVTKKHLSINLKPSRINLGESSKIIIKRNKLLLPEFRVILGDFSEGYELESDISKYKFYKGTDSIISINLLPESKGVKSIKGIIEEYKIASKDSIYSLRNYFSIELDVE